MWTWLASLIGGPVITGLINAYKAKLDAANTQDRIAADLAAKEIEAEIEARKQASAIIIAEQGRWYTAIIRPLLAFPIIIYFWKVMVWDKVLGLGQHRSDHRHDRRLDRHDHHRLCRRAVDREGRADLCEAIMTHEEILRERVAKLEVQMTHLADKLDDTHSKVEEMHAILLQAKGARWVIVGLAGVAGLASGLVAKLMP